MTDRVEDMFLAWQAPRAIGPYWDVVQAPSPGNRLETIRLGVLNETFWLANRTGTAVAEYFYIVRSGLKEASYLFRGVKRRMKYRDDMQADEQILAYVWRPEFTFEWVGGRHSDATPLKRATPPGLVFAVLTRPNIIPDSHGVNGTILKWNWLDGDGQGRPIDWEERYNSAVWG